MLEIPVDQTALPELESEVDYGEAIEEVGIFCEINDRPIPLSVAAIFKNTGQPLPPELTASGMRRRLEAWIVPHFVKIIRRRGNATVRNVGIEVEYETDGGTCSIVSLLPAPEYCEWGKAELRGMMSASGEVDLGGEIPDIATGSAFAAAGLRFSHAASMGLGIHVNATLVTPIVSAGGVNSSRCEWRFTPSDKPLFGRDIQAWSIVVLPKRTAEIRFRMRFDVTLRKRSLFEPPFYCSPHRSSEWQLIRCPLRVE